MGITITNKLLLQKLPQLLEREHIGRLTFRNPAYVEAERMGRWLGNLDAYICCYKGTRDGLILHRGFARQLLYLCQRCGLHTILTTNGEPYSLKSEKAKLARGEVIH